MFKTSIIATLLGCTAPSIDGPIDYRSTGGLVGNADIGNKLHVEVTGDASAVCGGTRRTLQLDTQQLDDLHSAVYDALSYDRTYESCCDFPVQEIAVHVDRGVETFKVNSNASAPRDVTHLVQLVESLACGS